jgi:hypothetical protein
MCYSDESRKLYLFESNSLKIGLLCVFTDDIVKASEFTYDVLLVSRSKYCE